MQPLLRPSVRLKQAHMFVLTTQNKKAEFDRRCRLYITCSHLLPHPQFPYILLPFSFTVHVLGRSELMLPLHLSHTPFLLFIFFSPLS